MADRGCAQHLADRPESYCPRPNVPGVNDAGETRQDGDGAPLAAALSRLRAARHAVGDVVEEPDADEVPLFVPAWLERSVPVELPERRSGPEPRTGPPPWHRVDADADADAGDAGGDRAASERAVVGDAEADALEHRLTDRRTATAAARQAAIAYAALNGHVPGGADDELERTEGRRWALRPRTALAATAAMLLLAVAAVVTFLWPHDATALTDLGAVEGTGGTAPDAVADGMAATKGAVASPSAVPSALLVVAVVGQVNSPGVVTLPEGSRVFDAVAAAGGATGDADLAAINLARPVTDGEQIVVPAPGETVPDGAASPDVPGDGGGTGPAASGLIDLNTADAGMLDTLPGIGPALAARIVDWRTANGPFASVDELDEVSGIGPALLAKVRDLVTV